MLNETQQLCSAVFGASVMDDVTPGSPQGEMHLKDYNYLALVLGVPLILVIILGNVLVCLSVLTERSLKTATNYFIVSLAVADLLLAVLVLPLYVYSEFLGVWTLSTFICDALMTMDVMLCTASILNLCAISVDRYIAVVVPLRYNRNQFSVRQLALITATWVLSLGVASPVLFGLNQVPGRDPSVCRLEDDWFVVYSSVCSFFVPCPVMLFLYYWIFRGLRRWSSRHRSAGGRAGRRALSLHLSSALMRRAKGQGKATYGEPAGLSPASPSAVSVTTPSATPEGAGVAVESDPMTTQIDTDVSPMKTNAAERGRRRRNSKSSRVSGRERKAMKVLPVVVVTERSCDPRSKNRHCFYLSPWKPSQEQLYTRDTFTHNTHRAESACTTALHHSPVDGHETCLTCRSLITLGSGKRVLRVKVPPRNVLGPSKKE
ncbi:dopamine receptor D4 related sequence isoform X2 [Anarrhichthys ocellatus]|uniref:dopamine receptor D4 related sequence isoform X2 n=1 Tax=Anarrhichthys ocellatus TaxID=433405 RepID=UPI0012EE5926|nr:D(4) dopamine receptor-like isoform X2 [Anarrhichthys ocellatus]